MMTVTNPFAGSPGQHICKPFRLMLLCFLVTSSSNVFGNQTQDSHVATTDRYEFHSNFWLNLHHFLFAQARQPENAPGALPRRATEAERSAWNEAVSWYRQELADSSLLMDERLYRAKRALIQLHVDDALTTDALTEDHRTRLLATKPVYLRYFWRRHDLQNREIWSWHAKRILSLEKPVLDRIAELAQKPWPEGPIRVDLTWDANWAGAYCTINPIHAVVTSRPGGPDNSWPPGGWLELIFHEPSHALISPQNDPVARAIQSAALALDRPVPEQLWHGVLFYFSGSALREALGKEGVDHQLLMASEGIFYRYQRALFDHMPAYLNGDEDLETAILSVVRQLTEPASIPENQTP